MDCGVLLMTLISSVTTWMIYKLNQEETPGFDEKHIKKLEDTIMLVYLPCFILGSTNWRLDFFLTTPIALTATWIATTNVNSPERRNMDC